MLPLSEPLIPYYRFGLFYGIAGVPLLHLTRLIHGEFFVVVLGAADWRASSVAAK